VKKQDVVEKEEDFEDFPTLINLKKTANKYRTAR
jgi:hypothetical protein